MVDNFVLFRKIPVDGIHSFRIQVIVGPGERFASEEPPVCRKGGRMGGFDDVVLFVVDHSGFGSGIISPQDKNNVLPVLCKRLNGRVGELFPPFVPV